jgi:hypothetical protein
MSDEARLLVVVRRGATERLEFMTARLANEPVRVVWDRRIAVRRQRKQRVTVERRHGDRRGPPPLTWRASGFVIARLREPAVTAVTEPSVG